MSKINTGGAAFPSARMSSDGERIIYENEGLSIRDYFAGQAFPALLNELYATSIRTGKQFENVYAVAAGASYEMADAMIKARGEQ